MSSSLARRARQKISKTTFHRMVGLQPADVDGKQRMVDGLEASLLDVPASETMVALVPPSMSIPQARDVEHQLTEVFQRPVVVLSNNIQLLRVEGPLSRAEIKAALKGVDGNADEIVDQLLKDHGQENLLDEVQEEGFLEEENDEEEGSQKDEEAAGPTDA